MSDGFFDGWEPTDTGVPKDEASPPNPTKDAPILDSIHDTGNNTPSEAPPGPPQALPLDKSGSWPPKTSNPANAAVSLARLRNQNPHFKTFVLCGMAGAPKSGKTGSVLDSLTEEEKDAGAEIWHLDFDLGGETTKAAHHEGSRNILVLNPWVTSVHSSRVPYDYPATFQRTLDILNEANDIADRQTAYLEEHGRLPKPYLKTICFDGADHWLHICETVMKVDDLKLGPDGIAVAGRETTTKIGRFNWNVRKTRYNSAMSALQELCRRGIHCYLVTHMKSAYNSEGQEIPGAETAHWLKDTEGWLQQVVIFEIDEERDERGELTGIVDATAILTQHRTSLKSPGRVHIFQRNSKGGDWFGWPGLRDGTFESPDDVKIEKEK